MSTREQGDASPPIQGKDDLVAWIADGAKPKETWRIGTEHEKFGFHTDDLTPLPYEGPRGIRALLQEMINRFGWEPILEGGNPIALKRPKGDPIGGNISLEAITITSAGSVGIGTSGPAAALDVRGDIRLGSAGQYQAPAGEERLRILRGRISSTGAVSLGSGFSATRTAVGLYTITPSTSFSGTPALTVSPSVGASGGPYCAHTNGVTTVSAGVRIMTASGTNIDDSFDFILIGPR